MANGTDLQEAYRKALLENMQPKNTKEEMWASVIENALPNIGKIVAATTMSGAGSQAFNQATDEGMARSQAQRQAYKLAQDQKQKDFMQILKDQMVQEQEGKRYEQEKGFKEGQAKTQAEQFAQELDLKKTKQAEELATKQRELALKQMEIDAKTKSGGSLTPEDKKYQETRGTSKANAQTAYEESMANFEPLEKQLKEAIELVPNTITGPLSGIELTGRRYGLGSKDKLANTARLQTIINKQVLAGLSNFKGAISDKEREFLEKMVGGGTGATAKEIQARLSTILENLRNDVKSKQKAFERFNGKNEIKKDSLGIL
jgi:hypothetical protein